VGPRAGLDTEARGKILCPCRGSNLDRPVVQPVVRHYTNPAPNTAIAGRKKTAYRGERSVSAVGGRHQTVTNDVRTEVPGSGGPGWGTVSKRSDEEMFNVVYIECSSIYTNTAAEL